MNRIKHHVKKGDHVEVISGNFRGSSGKILQVLPKKNRVLIEGVRLIKKHLRKSQDNPSGSIAEREGPIHISNVKLVERTEKEEEEQSESNEGEEDEVIGNCGHPALRSGRQYEMKNEFYREYKERVMPALREQHGYKNDHQIPKLEKVVINTSVGSQSDVKQALEDAKTELALITGQKPAETRAKKSISNFKLRKEQAIGAKVTLRGERMYEFMERLIKASLPRIRDFRGVSPKGFDGNGNYTLGVSDQSIFPEVELDKIKRNIGFDVTIVTTARTNEEAKSLLSEMGMPFSDRPKKPVAQAA
jgi:large subunit ribosomal protein L5